MFASIAESQAAAKLAPFGIIPYQTFYPHFQEVFTDKKGHSQKMLPDFKYEPPIGLPIYFELKDSILNSKTCHASCETALTRQYHWRYGSDAPTLSYNDMSRTLWNAGFNTDCLNNAWNHSLAKVLIIQRILTPANYVVLFTDNVINSKHHDNVEFFEKADKKGLFYLPVSKAHTLVTPH